MGSIPKFAENLLFLRRVFPPAGNSGIIAAQWLLSFIALICHNAAARLWHNVSIVPFYLKGEGFL